MSKKAKKIEKVETRKHESKYHVLTNNRGFLKIEYKQIGPEDIFSLAFGRCDKYTIDNCRILGYDTRHHHDGINFGPCHRHYLGNKTNFEKTKYDQVYPTFERQWLSIDHHFKTNESLNNYILN